MQLLVNMPVGFKIVTNCNDVNQETLEINNEKYTNRKDENERKVLLLW